MKLASWRDGRSLEDIDENTHVHVSLMLIFLTRPSRPGRHYGAGGLLSRSAFGMEMIADAGTVGSLDIMELNPAFDDHNKTARLAVDLVESCLANLPDAGLKLNANNVFLT